MASSIKFLLAVFAVWMPLASALFAPKMMLDVLHEKNTDLLSKQECWNKPFKSPTAPPVNETDLYLDAKRFCAGAAKQLPEMRLGAVIKGNGRGDDTKQHFEMKMVDPCKHGLKKQDTLDPLGKGKYASPLGDNWCTKILVDNWRNCKDQGGIGGSRMGGCVLFTTGAGHLDH